MLGILVETKGLLGDVFVEIGTSRRSQGTTLEMLKSSFWDVAGHDRRELTNNTTSQMQVDHSKISVFNVMAEWKKEKPFFVVFKALK
jgi:hypothetical protein